MCKKWVSVHTNSPVRKSVDCGDYYEGNIILCRECLRERDERITKTISEIFGGFYELNRNVDKI